MALAVVALPKALPVIGRTWTKIKRFILSDIYTDIRKLKEAIGLTKKEDPEEP